jgi:hypothetical protein
MFPLNDTLRGCDRFSARAISLEFRATPDLLFLHVNDVLSTADLAFRRILG